MLFTLVKPLVGAAPPEFKYWGPTLPSDPHAITVPSVLSAAKAPVVENMLFTLVKPLVGAVPPLEELPHAITVPSVLSAAKAPIVENMFCTFDKPLGAAPPEF